MPRYFETLADAQAGVGGYKRRAAFAAAKQAAEAAKRADPAQQAIAAARRAILTECTLAAKVTSTVEHRSRLEAKLRAARAEAASASDRAFRTGTIGENAAHLRAQIEGLPALIDRADSEVRDAERALTEHRAAMRASEDALPAVADEPETDAPAESEPVEPAPAARRPGRPKKVREE